MIETTLLFITCPLLAFFFVLWLFQKNTAKEARHRQAADGAAELKAWGLEWAPKLLNDYATSSFVALAQHVHQMLDLFTGKDGPKHVMAELEGTFKRVLEIKLSTKEGRDFITSELATASKT